jgi:hypothetical protein
MFNINFKGKYKNEEQIKRGKLPKNAVIFQEPNSITKAFLLGTLISLPIIIIMLIGFFIKVENLKNITMFIFYSAILLALICSYLHEIIHALCFPREVEKEIWVDLNQGALFVYCNKAVTKKRFIWMCISPNLVLGFIPYILFVMGALDFNRNISNIVGIFSCIMIASGIGDYLNIYNTIKQVPSNAKVIGYGIHSFWFLNEQVE